MTENTTRTETLAEDLLLLLFQPDSGTIAGEVTLYYVLAGGVLAELGLADRVRVDGGKVAVVSENPPADELLRATWDYVLEKPRGVQTVLAAVRAALVDGVDPDPRIAALAALVSASGTLPQFHRDIPWTSPVIARAKEFERGEWGAGAAAEAVTRTMTAIIVNSVVVAMAVAPKG